LYIITLYLLIDS